MITTCVFLDDETKMCRNGWSFVVINGFRLWLFRTESISLARLNSPLSILILNQVTKFQYC